MTHHLREIADRLDEALRLQSRVMDLTEQVYEAAGMSPGDRTLRGKVTGLFFGLRRTWRSSIAWPKTTPEDATSAAKPRWGASRWPRGWIAIC